MTNWRRSLLFGLLWGFWWQIEQFHVLFWFLSYTAEIFLHPANGYACWRHQMETFSALLSLCEGNPPITGGFPSLMPVMRSFEIFFDLRMNKRLSKQSRRRWFETPSHSLWRHCHGYDAYSAYNQDLSIVVIITFKRWWSHQCGL